MKNLLSIIGFVLMAPLLFSQVFTGTTLQFNNWTGNLGIGSNSTIDNKLYVAGSSSWATTAAILGEATSTASGAKGVEGKSPNGAGVYGFSPTGYGIAGASTSGYAGYFTGRVYAVNPAGQVGTAISARCDDYTAIHGKTDHGVAISGIATQNGYAGKFIGPVELSRVNGLLPSGSLSLYANSSYSDGASISLWPNSDPSLPGDIALQLGTSGEFRFERYDNGSSSYKRYMTIHNNGNVGIGTTNISQAGYRLFVQKGIITGKVKVDQSWADYVFDKNYDLPAIAQVDSFIQENGHLPNVPSQSEITHSGGFELGDMTRLQQEKIEELFLYIIELEKRVKELEAAEGESIKISSENK